MYMYITCIYTCYMYTFIYIYTHTFCVCIPGFCGDAQDGARRHADREGTVRLLSQRLPYDDPARIHAAWAASIEHQGM